MYIVVQILRKVYLVNHRFNNKYISVRKFKNTMEVFEIYSKSSDENFRFN